MTMEPVAETSWQKNSMQRLRTKITHDFSVSISTPDRRFEALQRRILTQMAQQGT